jgi:hypothetical protein
MSVIYTNTATVKVPQSFLNDLTEHFAGKPFYFVNDTSAQILDLDAMRDEDDEDNTDHISRLTLIFIEFDTNIDALADDVSKLEVFN